MSDSDRTRESLPAGTHPADVAGWRAFEAISQRSSRRGFLARVGRVTFAIFGVTVAEQLLPIGVSVADTEPCGSVDLCGFCGRECGCGNCSGDVYSCPGCACVANSWSACCCAGGQCHLYRYHDCYSGNNGCSQDKVDNCNNCTYCCGPQYPNTGPYKDSCGGDYMCSKVHFVGAC
jgi:hypothetical protein